MPVPIGTAAAAEPNHVAGDPTIPADSPGQSRPSDGRSRGPTARRRGVPARAAARSRSCRCSRNWARICRTVSSSVGWTSASANWYPPTSIESGTVSTVEGVISPALQRGHHRGELHHGARLVHGRRGEVRGRRPDRCRAVRRRDRPSRGSPPCGRPSRRRCRTCARVASIWAARSFSTSTCSGSSIVRTIPVPGLAADHVGRSGGERVPPRARGRCAR